MFKDESEFEKVVDRLRIDTKPNPMHRGNLRRKMLAAFNEEQPAPRIIAFRTLRRTIMKSRISQLTAAAMIIIVVLFSITFFDKAATPAYALEQTIEARHTIKTVHLRMFERGKSIINNEFSDYWIKYDDTGKLSKLRCNEHDNNGIVGFTIWKDGIKKTWIPAENVVIVKKLNFPAKRWEEFAKKFDYELLLKWIDQAKEEIELKIDEPAGDSDFIYVKATSSVYKARLELIVDRKTKLIKKYSEYGLKEHGDEPGMRIEFLAYNQPIDPSRFELRKIPDNVKVIDKLGDIIPGLRVGDFTLGMSKDEVLRKLGEPDTIMYGDETYTLNNLPRRYLMAFDNVSFFIYDDSVVSIGVYSSLYTFINGLGVGDSEQKIRQAFGGNFEFEEYEKYDVLNYKDKGLRFEIHKKSRSIMEISVRGKMSREH